MATLARWYPMREMRGATHPMDQMFDELRNFSLDTARPTTAPAMDLIDHQDYAEIRMNLPGINPSEVDIQFRDGVLTIATNAERDEQREAGNFSYRERYRGSYRRSLRVGETMDMDAATATFENGVLTLHIPKREEPQPVRIRVNSGQPELAADAAQGMAQA